MWSVAIHWHTQWSWLVTWQSSCCQTVPIQESTLPKHEDEPWSVPSIYHNINDKAFTVTKVKVRCIKVWRISSPGLFLSLWPLPLRFDARFVAKNISGRPTNTLQTHWHSSIHGNRFMINRVMVLFPTQWHKIFIGVTIIIFRYECKQLIPINVFNPVDPKIFYSI